MKESHILKPYKISAVIVSYNDYSALNRCIQSIHNQVDTIIVIDNSTIKDEFINEQNSIYIKNKGNLGLSKALNKGIKEALKIQSDWVLLLDQDSIVAEDMIKNMLKSYKQTPPKNNIAAIVPTIFDNNLNKYLPSLIYNKFSITKIFNPIKDEFVDFQITSGSLIKKTVFENIGLMDEELFIDYIDFDFCFKARIHGYKILLSHTAILKHSLGEQNKRLFFTFIEHNPTRVYYQIRNRLILMKRYRKEFPFFIVSEVRRMILKFFKIVLLESDKIKKLKSYCKGLFDGFSSK